MTWQILFILALSVFSGTLYRIGGSAKDGGWLDPVKNTKARDFGCPLIGLLSLSLIVSAPWWVYFLSFGLMFGSMVSYHKWVGRLLGYDDGNVHWPSWAFVGFLFGVSAILFGCWPALVIRTLVLTFSVCLWSEVIDDAVLEESGRGFLFNISLLFYLIN